MKKLFFFIIGSLIISSSIETFPNLHTHPACKNDFQPKLSSRVETTFFPHRIPNLRKASELLNLESLLREPTSVGIWTKDFKTETIKYSIFAAEGHFTSAFCDGKDFLEQFEKVLEQHLPLSSCEEFDYEPMVLLIFDGGEFIIYLRSLSCATNDKFIRKVDNELKTYSYAELLKYFSIGL